MRLSANNLTLCVNVVSSWNFSKHSYHPSVLCSPVLERGWVGLARVRWRRVGAGTPAGRPPENPGTFSCTVNMVADKNFCGRISSPTGADQPANFIYL